MRKNFDVPILDLDGKEIKVGDVIQTLGHVSLSALLATFEDERALTGKQKADRMQLALKINSNMKEVDLTIEQLNLVKELIGKGFGPLVVGRAYELLEKEPELAAVVKS